MHIRYNRIFISILLCANSIIFASLNNNIKVLGIRVEFPVDNNDGTSGDGHFLLEEDGDYCNKYTIDPPPHDKKYFESQLKAVDNYYRTVSKQHFGVDLINSAIYPLELQEAYLMPNEMSYYHPLAADLDESERTILYEGRIVQLFYDAITTAHDFDNIDFAQFDVVVVFHAGISQDFNIDLDTTPEDIPSTYIDYDMIQNYYGSSGIEVGNDYILKGIILPETQNHVFYPEFVENIQNSGVQDICEYQYGLTGTFAMMIGQSIGLPPLWNTDSGQSGVGVFGLMDQGSNNGHGIIPAMPTAWSRVFMSWDEPVTIIPNQQVNLKSQPQGNILKIDINEDEYYLIENRTNWYRSTVGLDSAQLAVYLIADTIPNVINLIFDSIGVSIDDNGVITEIPDYDIGLPGSGLLIWHIDESMINNNINSNSINNNPKYKGIDLEEAGGPQDIGYVTTAIFRDPSIGESYDMWYAGNLEYKEINPTSNGTIEFSPFTYPNTNSNRGALSNLTISDIGIASDTMQFSISNNFSLPSFPDTSLIIRYIIDLNDDGKTELIGGGSELWWSEIGKNDKNKFYELPSDMNYLVITNSDDNKNLAILSDLGDSLKTVWFKFDGEMILNNIETVKNTHNSITHITGFKENNTIDIFEESSSIHLINNKNNSNTSAMIGINGGITIGNQSNINNEIIFKYIAGIDLDLDGNPEVVAIDENGTIYAFYKNSTLSAGFPIDYEAIAPVLAKDIIGDEYPEIIFKNVKGDIIILDHEGKILYQLSGYKNSDLVLLAAYDDRNAVVTESNILLFDGISDNNGNEWITWHGDLYNSNSLVLDYTLEVNQSDKLFDKKKTYIYPNPVRNNMAKIRLFNYSAKKVEIKIYDAAGYYIDQIIKDIDTLNGVWETEWSTSGVDSGVYLIRLIASDGNNKESVILKLSVIH